MKICRDIPKEIVNIVTDSRRITPSQIADGETAFVALKTRIGDGHRFVRPLYEQGLRTFVIDDASQFADLTDATLVEAGEGGTLNLLIEEAGRRLARSGAKQIVITGSKKKTTTKELIYRALRIRGINVARSPRTWNSAMGIALSLFDNLQRKPDVIITEVGIDAPRQVERIAPMIRPEIGIITGVTDEHDDAFADHAAKVSEKIALVRNAKRIVYLDNDPELRRQLEALNHDDLVAVDSIAELVEVVSGTECPTNRVSTQIEIRRAPNDCVLFIDSFTNDIDSLPLSLALASERRMGRKLTVFLGDFEGDKDAASQLVTEIGGDVHFFSRGDSNFVSALKRDDFRHRLIMFKGATPELVNFFDEARHDTTLEVDLDALVHNYNEYRKLLPNTTGLIGMVKADAYGLGALEVAKTLQAHGAASLAVAVVDEGVELRKAGITMPIIVLNPITNRFEALVEYDLEPAVFSLEGIGIIEEGVKGLSSAPLRVHIKLDTGMHRVGFTEHDIPRMIERLKNSPLLRPASVFSHLATADCPDQTTYTQGQAELFDRLSQQIVDAFPGVKRHLLNTAGIETMSSGHTYEMARLGIGLYGISASGRIQANLRNVASLYSTVISLRHLKSGESVGYGRRGIVTRDSVIATLPLGYADGINRHLGNGNISFDIDGVKCPTIGNICMDLLMLDVTDAVRSGVDVKVGTRVEIMGNNVPVETHADILQTIPYEILTSVSPRVRRTYHYR